MSPKGSTRSFSVDSDTMHIDDPDLNEISEFSKNTQENTGLFSVSAMLEVSVSHVSLGESKDSMRRESVERQREKKEKVLRSVLQSRCQGKVDGTVLEVVLFRLTENTILTEEISEKTWNEEFTKLFWVKIQLKENYI